jgi:hypothetical protein
VKSSASPPFSCANSCFAKFWAAQGGPRDKDSR